MLGRRAAGLLFGAIVAVAILELGVRVLPAPVLGFSYEDGLFLPPREYERQTLRNGLGVHDVEPLPARDRAGRRRVLLLGDSYVAAISVPVEQGVARRLAHHLDARSPASWDVVALSSEGWGQREELAALERHGRALAPDLVLLLFTARNDPFNNALELEGREADRRVRREIMEQGRGWTRAFRSDEARGLWLEPSALNRLVAHRLTVRALRPLDPVPLPFLAFSPQKSAMWRGAWDETAALLAALRDRSAALGAGFAVASGSTPEGVLAPEVGAARLRAAHPALAGLDFDVDLVDRELERRCRALGIPFRALQPALRALEATAGPLHWRHDGHWNEAGNDAAARLLADFVASGAGFGP